MRRYILAFAQLALLVCVVGLNFTIYQPTHAMEDCPEKSRAMPVISWLVAHIDSVTVRRFKVVNGESVEAEGYPKTTENPQFINNLLTLIGSFVQWNGYDSPS